VADGVVRFSGIHKGWGNYKNKPPGVDEHSKDDDYASYGSVVKIYHGKDEVGREVVTFYAHNHARLVEEGEIVHKGQDIAKIGSSGASTGPHVHFEVRINGTRKNPLDYLE